MRSKCIVCGGAVLGAAVISVFASRASAGIYTDATGDNNGGPEVDIASVEIVNDATNISFKIRFCLKTVV
jgi:hypothetical protein